MAGQLRIDFSWPTFEKKRQVRMLPQECREETSIACTRVNVGKGGQILGHLKSRVGRTGCWIRFQCEGKRGIKNSQGLGLNHTVKQWCHSLS